MRTALVLACLFSLSLSGSRVASQDPGAIVLNQTQDNLVTENVSREITHSIFNKTSERMITPSPVTPAKGTLGANHSSPAVTAGGTHRTDVGTSATVASPSNFKTSRAPMLPASMSTRPPLSSMATLSTPHTQVPSNSTSPKAPTVVMQATSTQTAAATTAGASSPRSTQSPAEHTPSHLMVGPVSPTSPQALNTFTQGPTTQELTAQPASRPSPYLTIPTLDSSPSPVVSTSAKVTSATQAQAERPAPVPHTSPTPGVEATSPTILPSPVSSWGTTGSSIPPTEEQVQSEATGGTTSTRPTTESSGDPRMPTTDSCQLSTQSQYLVVTTKPLPLSSVNRSALLAMLLVGVTLFFTVLVLFALQAYESYKKKDYTQVDYLINGMYADSEM